MDEITKRAVKKTILTLRSLLEKEDIPAVLKQHGIFPDRRRVPAEKIALLDDAGRSRRERLEAILEREIKSAGNDPKAGVERYCREVAFTFLNRLIGLRCMETRGLIDECIKIRVDYAERSLRHTRYRRENPEARFDSDDADGLKAFLRSVFSELQDDIKILFDPEDEYSIIMPSLKALRECICALNEDIPEDAFKEPELIGWVYQYFQTEEKNRVFEEVRTKKKKIQGDDIVPATSLYTERYMVDYLVQNSLGAIWIEMYPDSKLCQKWPYFVKDQDLKPRDPRPVKSLTLLDPACGSGHFLLIAFDLLFQMYEEEARLADEGEIPRDWVVSKEKIATTIIESNLHGIDIDLRSVQLSWLVLYLKMREHQKSVAAPKALPEKVNLVAADASLLNSPEFLSWCEERFKEEPYAINIIKGVAKRLRNLPEIGSLARPEEDLKGLIHKEKERLLSAWKKAKKDQLAFDFYLTDEQKELPFDKITDEQFWDGVLRRVIKALDAYYHNASEQGNTRTQVMAHEAARGFGFLELCNKRYDVVATNPPYLGTRKMGAKLKAFIATLYPFGKRDLYASFVLRCIDFAKKSVGRVSMITPIQWMFLRDFTKLRNLILSSFAVETIVHLGLGAFGSQILVFPGMFTIRKENSRKDELLLAIRAIHLSNPVQKAALIKSVHAGICDLPVFKSRQEDFMAIPAKPFVYWVRRKFVALLHSSRHLASLATVRPGLQTGNNNRFTRFFWELKEIEICNSNSIKPRWIRYAKGGRYQKWYGLDWRNLDWKNDGKVLETYTGSTLRNSAFYFHPGLTYTLYSNGSMGVRVVEHSAFDVGGMCVFTHNATNQHRFSLACLLNSRVVSYLLRTVAQDIKFQAGTVEQLPVPSSFSPNASWESLAQDCIIRKQFIIETDLIERHFVSHAQSQLSSGAICERYTNSTIIVEVESAILHSCEGLIESKCFREYGVANGDLQAVIDETGFPAGWHPLIIGYDAMPQTYLRETPKEVVEYVNNHKRINPSREEISAIKSRLRALYGAGPGAKMEDVIEEDETNADKNEDVSDALTGRRIPIPTETFLEELSDKMEIHPISIYWLLKEMREKESVVCWPQCKRYMEDYLTVMILRMLGFRWPKQLEAEEPVPEWADKDGIIPITDHTGEKTLLERIRDRIGAEFGEDRIGAIEQEFSDILYNAECKEAEVKGRRPPRKKMSLSEWLEREFFKRHTSQFKKRPIAWHLTSSNGTFQVLLFYHKLSGDVLKNLKNRYLARVQSYYGVLLERARSGESVSGGLTLGRLQDIEAELEDIAAKLDKVMDLPYEPLIDDGVRVNIAPLQKVGVLKYPVLTEKDVDRAIADRNRWREDDKEQNTVWRI